MPLVVGSGGACTHTQKEKNKKERAAPPTPPSLIIKGLIDKKKRQGQGQKRAQQT